MRIAHFEPIGGVSGNILLGAWLDAGLAREPWLGTLRSLGLGEWELQEARVERAGVAAQWIDFAVTRGVTWDALRVAEWPVSAEVRSEFLRLAARVDPGAWSPGQVTDFCLDVVGFLLAREQLGVGELTCSAIPIGLQVRPQVAALLTGAKVQGHDFPAELTTVTGALLLTSLCEFRPARLEVERIGCGAGTDEFPLANVTRLWLGSASSTEMIWQLECNLDDLTPQQLAPSLEGLLAAGALDAWIAPVVMKKGRPAFVLSVLARAGERGALEQQLLRDLPTLGVRSWAVERRELPRTIVSRETPWGAARFKEAPGRPARVEFDDAQALASVHGVPLWQMMRRLESWADRLNS